MQGSANECFLGCVIPASWLPPATGARFTQPRDHSLADPCTYYVDATRHVRSHGFAAPLFSLCHTYSRLLVRQQVRTDSRNYPHCFHDYIATNLIVMVCISVQFSFSRSFFSWLDMFPCQCTHSVRRCANQEYVKGCVSPMPAGP